MMISLWLTKSPKWKAHLAAFFLLAFGLGALRTSLGAEPTTAPSTGPTSARQMLKQELLKFQDPDVDPEFRDLEVVVEYAKHQSPPEALAFTLVLTNHRTTEQKCLNPVDFTSLLVTDGAGRLVELPKFTHRYVVDKIHDTIQLPYKYQLVLNDVELDKNATENRIQTIPPGASLRLHIQVDQIGPLVKHPDKNATEDPAPVFHKPVPGSYGIELFFSLGKPSSKVESVSRKSDFKIVVDDK